MEFLLLKWIHILSSTLLFGTGLGTAFYKWWGDRSGDVRAQATVMRGVVLADWLFTTPAVVVQLLTGLWMALRVGYPLDRGWILWALCLYFLAGACWLPVLWLQLRMRDMAVTAAQGNQPLPVRYWRYQRIWFALGVPAFSGLVVVFWLMVFKPSGL
ncbi:MAG TPA: DUF2269 domain-containing protein [Solimonas sp.]|nr:DUF2269 domain-containing protein [Solimonas sp.]